MFITGFYRKKMEECVCVQMMGEEEEEQTRCKEEEKGCKVEGEEGGGVEWRWGPCAGHHWGGTCLMVRGKRRLRSQRRRWQQQGWWHGQGSLQIANMRWKETRGIGDDAKERGGRSLTRHVGI
jgi:hypothetical protein